MAAQHANKKDIAHMTDALAAVKLALQEGKTRCQAMSFFTMPLPRLAATKYCWALSATTGMCVAVRCTCDWRYIFDGLHPDGPCWPSLMLQSGKVHDPQQVISRIDL